MPAHPAGAGEVNRRRFRHSWGAMPQHFVMRCRSCGMLLRWGGPGGRAWDRGEGMWVRSRLLPLCDPSNLLEPGKRGGK